MKKYIVTIPQNDERNAGPKARRDIEALALRAGYTPIAFDGARTSGGRLLSMLHMALDGVKHWRMLEKTVAPGSLVLVQYPHYPLKTAYLMTHALTRIRRRKGVRFIALIHDLNSLRGMFGKTNRYADDVTLRRFDGWICHNDSMRDWMADHGFPKDGLIPLGLFDYLTDAPLIDHRLNDGSIAVAGNLEKSGYLHELTAHLPDGVTLDLYGVGFRETDAHPGTTYHGSFTPEELPGKMTASFGLVWDGERMDTCTGLFGEYMRLNDPHKVSLYLASGMPVIVWDQAAVAPFITANRLGVTVDDLSHLNRIIASITDADYAEMADNARRFAHQLREGHMFTSAEARAAKA